MLPGYEMFRRDRSTGNKGGGVLLYVWSGLLPMEVQLNTDFPEHVWCRITEVHGDELLIGVCYRSGNASIYPDGSHTQLRNMLTEVQGKRTLIMGDFNYPDID